MKSERINREIVLTSQEREELSKELIKAGIDKKVVGELLGGIKADVYTTGGCWPDEYGGCPDKCQMFHALDKKAADQLYKIIKEKNINPKALGKVGSKFEKRS